MLKHVLNDFIERRVGDRLGLILFADTAYVQNSVNLRQGDCATNAG